MGKRRRNQQKMNPQKDAASAGQAHRGGTALDQRRYQWQAAGCSPQRAIEWFFKHNILTYSLFN